MTTLTLPITAGTVFQGSGPTSNDLAELARMIGRYAPYQGSHDVRLPGVSAIRFDTTTDLVHGVYRPSVCIVAQGAKRVLLGADIFEYSEARLLMSSVELPVTAQVVRAIPDQPYLGVTIALDPQRIAALSQQVFLSGRPPLKDTRGVGVTDSTSELVNAATRLLKLMSDERDLQLIAPLVMDEILIRLLRGQLGARLAHLGQDGSNLHRVGRAIDWIRDHFDEPMNVEYLAEMLHMSLSSFHAHFKAVTNMSPLQFQKNLRLREARRRMLTLQRDVTTASREVGYVSSSQFIREYGRLFGNAPAKDIAQLREQSELSKDLN